MVVIGDGLEAENMDILHSLFWNVMDRRWAEGEHINAVTNWLLLSIRSVALSLSAVC